MRVGDVSRARRFANPARLRWYAFHRSVRFALRMMKAEDTTPTSEAIQHQLIDLPLEIHQCQEPCPSPDLNGDSFELKAISSELAPTTEGPAHPGYGIRIEPS